MVQALGSGQGCGDRVTVQGFPYCQKSRLQEGGVAFSVFTRKECNSKGYSWNAGRPSSLESRLSERQQGPGTSIPWGRVLDLTSKISAR